ncbi:MAG: hypothetical protein UT42_C0035G0008 [Candidatus Falkowbacteria bacterium GW2011_GWA2_39_24]|uniref:Uncharacterized protein n=1 Tax=Candidatus Falkowbacteria bacterium GW2011_GWA2_39_24 TaxID=1618634 RepID=A0A0G0NCQ8_9BACT|nr:MAG: hypothetical protein UT22_C0033G0008 [Parcubacteria group bacterium GW2011_GWC2_39_11]KKR13954.1 MAG: hypothetical protein UT42_C0035G0008 [Candidatus Falkowbacteria bacterium GW2011_GWA2_39_24]
MPKSGGCTLEARICPDGSAVGRSDPNCEFAPCPTDEASDWKIYKNEEYGFEMRYPKWWNVYELNERILFKDAPLEDIPDEWFSVNIKNNEYDFSNYDFSKEKMVDKITGKEEINISDIKGFRYTFYPKSEIYILTKYIILNYKGQGWALSYGYDLSQELENQMLSTFRFLK